MLGEAGFENVRFSDSTPVLVRSRHPRRHPESLIADEQAVRPWARHDT
jgi:hypothetical protein